MKISDKLSETYSDYYRNQAVLLKRAISGRQTLSHLQLLLEHTSYPSILDVGAGDGSVLRELDRMGMAADLHAVEISSSGCDSIRQKQIASLRSVSQFDGYTIDAPDQAYTLGLAIHVLEHVEHERVFLAEVSRVCEQVYVEVPLELTFNTERSIQMASPYGHINFYTAVTFQNLLRTAGLEVLKFQVFANSLEYEVAVNGAFKGRIQNLLRTTALRMLPHKAGFFMTYMAGAVCRRAPA
jgi:ubiquinone/menaquinone biosynthesis C-methylase UbiE